MAKRVQATERQMTRQSVLGPRSLLALAMIVGVVGPGSAQEAPNPTQTATGDGCAEYFGCLHYGTLTEAEARTARGHPEFVEGQSVTVSSVRTPPDRATQEPILHTLARK